MKAFNIVMQLLIAMYSYGKFDDFYLNYFKCNTCDDFLSGDSKKIFRLTGHVDQICS